MKKNISILAIAALVACFATVSCEKETPAPEASESVNGTEIPAEPAEPSESDGAVVFSAGFDTVAETKTYITTPESDGSYVPKWNSSDKISVNGITSTNTADAARSADFTSANFTVEGVSAPYFAIAPYSSSRTFVNTGGYYKLNVNGAGSMQRYRKYTDESSDGDGTNVTYNMSDAILAAYSESSTNLTFKQLTAYYKLTINKGEGVADGTKIKTIYVRQNTAGGASTENIAGYWLLSYSGDDFTLEPDALTNIIGYNCMVNGSTATDGVAFGEPVIITIPAYNFSGGLIITVKDTEGHFQSYGIPASASDLSGKRGKLITKTLTYSPQAGTINSAEDWEAFAAAVNGSNDWDLYRWAGNGTVKIGTSFSAAGLTKITKWPAGYVFDGQGKTITQTAATDALFENVYGTIKNLTLDGKMSTSGMKATLATNVYPGAELNTITNEMDITISSASTTSAAAGIAAVASGGTFKKCINNGDITVATDCSSGNTFCRVAGILLNTTNPLSGPIEMTDCTNNGDITVNPTITGTTYGVQFACMGGVLGWYRVAHGTAAAYRVTLTNCDNTGNLTWSAAESTGPQRATTIGGIVGLAAPSGSNYLIDNNSYSESLDADGVLLTMKDCDNTGAITSRALTQGLTAAYGRALYSKVCVGGLAGALLGTTDDYAKIINCSNTGKVFPYDVVGGQVAAISTIVGGLVGWGGNIAFSSKTRVDAELGNGQRASFAVGGAVGCLIRPFTMDNCYIHFTGKFAKFNNTANNRALVACVIKTYANGATTPAPSISGSSITNSTLGCLDGNFLINQTAVTVNASAGTEDTADASSLCTIKQYNTETSITLANSVRGTEGSSAAYSATTADVTWSGNSAWNYSSNPTPWE